MLPSMMSMAILSSMPLSGRGGYGGRSSGPSLKGDELLAARDRKKRERKNKKKNRR